LEALYICFVRFVASNLKPQTSNIFPVFRQLVLGILAASKGRSNGIVFALHRGTNEQIHHKALARIFHVMKYPGLGLR